MAKNQKTFSVSAKVVLEVNVGLQAENLQTALEKAGELELKDFVTIEGDLYDSSFRVTSLYEQGINIEA